MSFPLVPCPVSLQPWQGYFQGLTFGAGTQYPMLSIDAGFDMVGIASKDPQFPRGEGELIGLDVGKGRDLDIDFWVAPVSGGTIQQLLLPLATAFQVQGNIEQPMWLHLPGWGVLGFMVRTRKRAIKIDLDYSAASLAKPSIKVHATDPVAYGPVQSVTSTGAQPVGGVSFPIAFPLTFAAVVGSFSATNNGNFRVYPIITFYGPLDTPTLTIGSLQFQLYNPSQGSNPTVPAGQTVTVDMRLRTVLLNVTGTVQQSSVASWVVAGSAFFSLPAATTTSIGFSTSSASTGYVTLQWADGFWL